HGQHQPDVTPHAISMTPDGRLTRPDFGIARIDHSSLTQVGSIMGTPAYMSPEQYAGQQVDRRSDIFSCGVVLYELLTGVKPFEGPTETVGYKMCHEPHRNPSEINPQSVPEVFDAILSKALAKKPEDRYARAREFAAALAKGFESRRGAPVPTEATVLPTIVHRDRPDTTSPPPGWEAGRLRALEELLAPYVGPMARVLVRRSARTTTDGATLVRLLAESVGSERHGKACAVAAARARCPPDGETAGQDIGKDDHRWPYPRAPSRRERSVRAGRKGVRCGRARESFRNRPTQSSAGCVLSRSFEQAYRGRRC